MYDGSAFKKRYMKDYDGKKNYVVMDDSTITEQSGYKTTEELYEEMIRAGKVLRANRLEVTMDELDEIDEFSSYETRYELDLVEQDEIVKNFELRLKNAIENTQSGKPQQTGADTYNQPAQAKTKAPAEESQKEEIQ